MGVGPRRRRSLRKGRAGVPPWPPPNRENAAAYRSCWGKQGPWGARGPEKPDTYTTQSASLDVTTAGAARASPRPWVRHGQRPARLGSAGCLPLGRSLPPQARAAASREPPDLRPVTHIEHLKRHLAHVGCSANVCRMMNEAAPDAAVKRMC